MIKRMGVAIAVILVLMAQPVRGESGPPPIESVVKRLQEIYARQCCFKASFDQVTVNVAMDLRDRFEGVMYVKRPGMIALDVESPERQKVVVKGRAYSVYFPADGTAVKGEAPPEMNVESFFGFLSNVNALDQNFSISYPTKSMDPEKGLIFLELTDKANPRGTYRIVIGVDMDAYIIRRAIIYDALGNYNRFELSDIEFLSELPDARFRAGPIPDDEPPSAGKRFLEESFEK